MCRMTLICCLLTFLSVVATSRLHLQNNEYTRDISPSENKVNTFLSRLVEESRSRRRKKRWVFTRYAVPENLRTFPYKVTTLHSSFDDDSGNVRYSITGQGAGSIFHIDAKTGDLTVLHKLDRESQSVYKLNVSARNLNGDEVENGTTITIDVLDKNDNPPVFPVRLYHASVKERSVVGEHVTTITANDADDPNGAYGQIEYSLLPSNGSNKFTIMPETGEVKTSTANLDRESGDVYELIIKAKDDPGSDLGRSATATLIISVIDVNDNRPLFLSRPYRAIEPENTKIGSTILRVATRDADLRENTLTSYSILPGPDSEKFGIKTVAGQGVISLQKSLDYETASNHQYQFEVKATNVYMDKSLKYLGPMEDTVKVIVEVTDVNEPPQFDKSQYTFRVSEDVVVGDVIQTIRATDPEGDPFSYSLKNGKGKFSISKTGMIYLTGKLDRETIDQYDLVAVAGTGGSFGTANVKIIVDDVNDNAPTPPNDDKLELTLCENVQEKKQALHPNIIMIDRDDPAVTEHAFHYYPVPDPVYDRHFQLVDNGDNTATIYTLHSDFSAARTEEYLIPVLVSDGGKPPLNATYEYTVRVCQCFDDGSSICDPLARAGGVGLEVLIVVLAVVVILLIVVVVLVTLRRRRSRRAETLLKGSSSTLDDDIRENILSYNEEGGEEDTDAFDLTLLQKDYCSSTSGSQVKSGMSNSSPSTKVSLIPPDYIRPLRRQNIPSQDIREFIVNRKDVEDGDHNKLAFDSLQIYSYEGEGSDAGSLSSLCTSSDDADQDYDYLKEWGPRFNRLADMYGTRQQNDDDDESGSDIMSAVMGSNLYSNGGNRPRRVSPC